jgi:hypothetical protein
MDMMLPPPSRQSLRLFATVVLLLAASPMPTGAQVILEPGLGAAGGQTVPTPGYDLVFAALANGDFSGGLTIAVREYQGSIKAGGRRMPL